MSLDLAIRTLAPLITRTSRHLGVELPTELAAAIEEAQELRDAARERDFLEAPSLASAIADALAAGKDPLASKDVQRAVLAQQVEQANIRSLLDQLAQRRAADAVLKHADALIDSWRPVVEQAQEAFSTFRALAPGVDPNAEDLPNGLPIKAMTPWGQARESTALLVQLSKGWVALATANGTYIPHGIRPLLLADLSFEQIRSLGTNPEAAEATRLDAPLDLATLDTFVQRVARVQQEQGEHAAWEAAAPERAREERRRTQGVDYNVVMIP